MTVALIGRPFDRHPVSDDIDIGSGFGMRTLPGEAPKLHNGLDYRAPRGTPCVSIGEGVIDDVFSDATNGNAVRVVGRGKHAAYSWTYCHLDSVSVVNGQAVKPGDLIGKSGNTGHVVGAGGGFHLHFIIRTPARGKAIDPRGVLPARLSITRGQS